MNTPNRITLTLRAADGQTLEPILPYVQIGAHVSIGRGLAVIDQIAPPIEPVDWGSPKTVRQLIQQLQTLDPDLETVALYRLPDGLGELSGKVKQGHISTSYERMEGIWLGPYKGSGRLVLAFWTKLDPRETPDGEYLTQTPAPSGEPADLLDQIDDFVARVNGADRGACTTINDLRAHVAQLQAGLLYESERNALLLERVTELEAESANS